MVLGLTTFLRWPCKTAENPGGEQHWENFQYVFKLRDRTSCAVASIITQPYEFLYSHSILNINHSTACEEVYLCNMFYSCDSILVLGENSPWRKELSHWQVSWTGEKDMLVFIY